MFLEVQNVSKTYQSGEVQVQALKNITMSIDKGEIGVILGPSGSGKSTLLNLIGGIDSIDQGSIIIDENDLSTYNDKKLTSFRREDVGFIFQFYNLIPNLTVYENVEVASNISKNPSNINDVLESVGMLDMKDRFPRELSGGQQQRVSIARAIVKNPKILLCDEPTGALDFTTAKDILKLLTKLNKENKTTILIITHNNALSGIANKIVRLRSGEIAEQQINENVLSPERIEW